MDILNIQKWICLISKVDIFRMSIPFEIKATSGLELIIITCKILYVIIILYLWFVKIEIFYFSLIWLTLS